MGNATEKSSLVGFDLKEDGIYLFIICDFILKF